ncbi:MAG: AraC family transcriptional regulator [Proteobacteria bacterium]|nr:MAG: AraC family transcriptional regulator [Pseudomonadota bacterium]
MTDPFSELLHFAKTESSAGGGLQAAKPWAIAFSKLEKIKCFGIVRGSCWLRFENSKWNKVEEGDILMLSGLKSYILASAPEVKAIASKKIFPTERGTFATIGSPSKADFEFVGGHTSLDEMSRKLLQSSLPSVVHIKSSDPNSASLMSILKQLAQEYKEQRPGSEVICNQLSHLLFLKILRGSVEAPEMLKPGWLRSVGNSKILPAIQAIHAAPGNSWTVAKLASACSLSRSTFMDLFGRETSISPLQYLAEWRMLLARQQIKNNASSVGELAESLGYSSESAFSHAFKRIVGKSPKAYREGVTA